MDSSIASLFDDDDLVEEVPKRHKTPHSDDEHVNPTRPAKRRRQTFADSDDEGVMPPREVNTRAMDDLGGGGDDDEEYEGLNWGGVEAAEREVAAKMKKYAHPPLTPHAILPSSSPPPEGAGEDGQSKKKGKDKEEKKPRKKPMVLNENLLVGPQGFPRLINDLKAFKPKGKGHEASDLNRLLQVYQFWTHQLYPKSPFRETVTRVEKLCHTRLLMSAASRWRDEAKGIVPPQEQENIDPNSDDEDVDEEARPPREAASDVDGLWEEPPSSRAPSRPPTSGSEHEAGDEDLYDEDIEALIQEDFARQGPSTSSKPSAPAEMDMDFDDDSLWENFDDPEMSAPGAAKPSAPTKPARDDGMEQDEWDALDDVDMGEPATKNPQPPPPTSAQPAPASSAVDDDMDDFYV